MEAAAAMTPPREPETPQIAGPDWPVEFKGVHGPRAIVTEAGRTMWASYAFEEWEAAEFVDSIADIEREAAALAAPGAALDVARKVHARHDLGHKLGAWPNACALCEFAAAYASLGATSDPLTAQP